MDSSREHDLVILHERMNDTSKPLWLRKQAHQMFSRIKDQLKDRKLAAMRLRLITAIRHDDADAADRIEEQIRDYSRHQKWFVPAKT